jgi:hypothetical protein
MKRVLFLILFLILFIAACTKEDDYFPTEIYNGSLTGQEILFSLGDASCIYAADIDGSNIRMISSFKSYFGASPSFLADHRVIAIKKAEALSGEKDRLVIIDKGEMTNINIDYSQVISIDYVTGLKGTNSDKFAYKMNLGDFGNVIEIYSLTDNKAVGGVLESLIIGKPAALPDGRIAYLTSENIKIIDANGNIDSQVTIPAGFPALFALSDGRFLIASAGDEDVEFWVSEIGPSEPWTKVSGFSTTFNPSTPFWGGGITDAPQVQICEMDKLVFVHEDAFEEDNPMYTVFVGDINGTSIMNINQIYNTKMSRVESNTYPDKYWIMTYIFWLLYD